MIGIDIISIKRFKKLVKDDFEYWNKFFSQDEWEYSFKKPDPHASLAGIYAAKEAVMKAVGGKVLGRADKINISHERDGKPSVRIEEKINKNIHISISHTSDTAVAVAIKYEQQDI
jgi:phosphopantetheine--protein transferase-like protein